MSKAVVIKRGVDIPLFGEAIRETEDTPRSDVFALKPHDFHGVIPKLLVKEGQEVKAGTPLFYDKGRENIKFTSPVSGEIAKIVRGDKRKILEITILPDRENQFVDFTAADPLKLQRDQVIEKLLDSGCWVFIKQRPYDIIANPDATPKSIFISGFDSSPLAPDYDFLLKDHKDLLQTGINVLRQLTPGKVHVGIRPGQTTFDNLEGIELSSYKGAHPAGNVGVQIHHTDPVNKGEVIWTVNPLDLLIIARLFKEGRYFAQRTIALVGSEVEGPKYFKTFIGSRVNTIIKNRVKTDNVRLISGNVLVGDKLKDENDFLGFYSHVITIIPEGNKKQFLLTEGWLSPGFHKFSLSHSYPTWLMPGKKKYRLDTNLNGEKRPFVMTGELEKVFPFDIYPMHLIKSIMINDIDLMEKLGIYEVAPEDFALCEFACTSKIDLQSIVRQGLDEMRKEFA